MMRAIEPDTEYQIYTVLLAVPLRLGQAAACDAINETLGPCVGAPEEGNQYWLADYQFFPGETVLSDSDPDAALEATFSDTPVSQARDHERCPSALKKRR